MARPSEKTWDVESWADGYADGLKDQQAEVDRLRAQVAQLHTALEQAPHSTTMVSYAYARWYREVRTPALNAMAETVTT